MELVHRGTMTKQTADAGLLGVLWAIVLLQGSITLLSVLEAAVGGFALGSILLAAPVITLTAAGAIVALASARGLRHRKRWARRVTIAAECLVLATGMLNLLLTAFLANALLGAVPLVTTIMVPITVLVLLRRLKGLFVGKAEPSSAEAIEPETSPVSVARGYA